VKIALVVLVVAIAGLLLVEIGLRWLYGFGNPLLYVADSQTGYRIAPNQKVKRYGNRIQINQYSMRGPEISATRPEGTLRILLLGDSIANGGWWTDQAEILSEQLSQQLTAQLNQDWGQSFQRVETLNASANSWGPRNELAYLIRFGHFESQVIVLLINTDDLFTIAPNSVGVGRDRNYPVQKPPLALVEVIQRYALKPKPIPEYKDLQKAESGDRVGANIEAIRQIKKMADEANIEFLLAMTPLLREIGEPGSRDYELKARQRLLDFTEFEQITYIDFLPLFNAQSEPATLFRDNIHLSSAGNQLVNQQLSQAIQRLLSPVMELPSAPSSIELQDVFEDPWS
jgi:hypothetical protein